MDDLSPCAHNLPWEKLDINTVKPQFRLAKLFVTSSIINEFPTDYAFDIVGQLIGKTAVSVILMTVAHFSKSVHDFIVLIKSPTRKLG